MKEINKNTVLKKGDKIYQPVEVDGVIYWVKESIVTKRFEGYLIDCDKFIRHGMSDIRSILSFNGRKIVVQSQSKLEGIPVISLNSYVERLVYGKIKNIKFKMIEKIFQYLCFHPSWLYNEVKVDFKGSLISVTNRTCNFCNKKQHQCSYTINSRNMSKWKPNHVKSTDKLVQI